MSSPPSLTPQLPGSPEPPPPSRPGEGLWMAPAALLLGLLGGVFSSILVELIGSAFGSSLSNPSPAVNLVADYFYDFAFVGAALYLAVLRGGMGAREFGYVRISWRRGIGAVVVAGIVYYLLTDLYASLLNLHGNEKLPSELGATSSTAALVASATFVCVVAPMAEEFFFRGFLFGVLSRMRVRVGRVDLGPWIAAVIVGLLFGLAHTGSASSQYLIPLGLLGFILCLVRWRTGSLYPCMALHSLNNCLALGVNQLSWGAGAILLLMAGSLAVIGLVTAPLSRPAPALAGPGRSGG